METIMERLCRMASETISHSGKVFMAKGNPQPSGFFTFYCYISAFVNCLLGNEKKKKSTLNTKFITNTVTVRMTAKLKIPFPNNYQG